MFEFPDLDALVEGILESDNPTKQDLGRRLAVYLNLTPGPGGPDDGVDGSGTYRGRRIHFQCRLRSTPLDKDDARRFYSDIKFHKAHFSIMLAGIGYKQPFRDRLFGHSDVNPDRVFLITLSDVLQNSPAFQQLVAEIPCLVPAREAVAKFSRELRAKQRR